MILTLLVIIVLLSVFLYESKKREKMFRANWMFCRQLHDLGKSLQTKKQRDSYTKIMSEDVTLDLISAIESGDSSAKNKREMQGIKINETIENDEVRKVYNSAMSEYRQIKSDSEPRNNPHYF